MMVWFGCGEKVEREQVRVMIVVLKFRLWRREVRM
jgi:hypothetical protein